MIKKLMTALLAVGLCLMGVTSALAQTVYPTLAEYERLTGKRIETFDEAPSLKVKVAAGELPSVEERLPEEPSVMKPRDEIGRYGGTLKASAHRPTSGGGDVIHPRAQHLFKLAPDLKTVIPNVAKGWEISKDLKTLTIYLRKGMKWSDGASFTADDFLFWYEDVILNDELTPVKPKTFSPGEELMKVKKMDDYTVQFQFAVSYPMIVDRLADYAWGYLPLPPGHYARKYHIRYNPKVNEIAKKEGYDYWWQCFNFHTDNSDAQEDVTLPVLDPWTLNKIDSYGNKYYERNPYYWKIDTAGNQLPYIDEQDRILVTNREVRILKTIAGEFDIVGVWQNLEDYPLYKAGEKKGSYRAMAWTDPRGSMYSAFAFNLTYKDLVLRKVFRDARFRQAMSLAIDRKEVNQVLFFGKGVPRQATADPDNSFYEEWMEKYYAEHNPEGANRLLDEMGLSWDKKHEYRLRPDGKTLAVTIEHISRITRVCELVKEYWEKVGVKVALKEDSGSLLGTRTKANEVCVGVHSMGSATEFGMRKTGASAFLPSWSHVCQPWRDWYDTGGKAGEEPPEEVRRIFDIADKWQTTLPGTEEYIKLGKEILTINVKNLWLIGVVGLVPYPVVIKSTLGNTPGEGAIWSPDYHQWEPYQAEQWFFKK